MTTTVYLPLAAAREQNHSSAGYSQLTLVTASGVDSASLCTELENWFNSKYYRSNDSFKVTAGSMESMVSSMTEMLSTVSIAISVIAGISLLVGGIGVMNIMLVSITERTREIGTRKALGATNGSIRLQFITESVVICLTGGFIGILLGLGLAAAARSFGLRGQSVGERHYFLGGLFHPHRRVFRLLSGQQGGEDESHRGPALRVKNSACLRFSFRYNKKKTAKERIGNAGI